jgi:ABC-type lipoprotein export system ATPase subunit
MKPLLNAGGQVLEPHRRVTCSSASSRCSTRSAQRPVCCRRTCVLQARGVNLLVLDEPTNHLDLPAIEQLESALTTYLGTLLLVTHDRRMLEAVQTNRHIDVDRGRVTNR